MMNKQKRGRYTLRDLKEDLGAVVALLVFLATLLTAVALPGFLADSASTVSSHPAREARQ